MKVYKQEGEILSVAAPYARASGEAMKVGSLFLVAEKALANGEVGAAAREGVYSIKKLSTAVVTVGAKLNWNDTNKELQLTTSDLDGVATAVEAAGNGVTSVVCVLTPV